MLFKGGEVVSVKECRVNSFLVGRQKVYMDLLLNVSGSMLGFECLSPSFFPL